MEHNTTCIMYNIANLMWWLMANHLESACVCSWWVAKADTQDAGDWGGGWGDEQEAECAYRGEGRGGGWGDEREAECAYEGRGGEWRGGERRQGEPRN